MTSCRQINVRRVRAVLVLGVLGSLVASMAADADVVGPPGEELPAAECQLFDYEGLAAGYVDLSFTVTQEGTVRDPYVIRSDACDEEAIPSMERAAIKAVLDFKYRPRVVDGEAVDVEGVKTRITFRLEEESEEAESDESDDVGDSGE